jgi:hypothetical protein
VPRSKKPASGSWRSRHRSTNSYSDRLRNRKRRGVPQGQELLGLAWAGAGGVFDRRQQKLLGISKRGNGYLRKLLVHGARAILQCRQKQSSGLSAWLEQLVSRAHPNIATIALANKMARMAWALLNRGETYQPLQLNQQAVAI